MKTNKWIFIFVFAALAVGLGGNAWAENQGWINNSLSLKISSNVNLFVTNETRYEKLTFMESFMRNWQLGLKYKLGKAFHVAAGYKRENTDKGTYNLAENRLTLEAGWKKKLGKKVTFDVRFRTEVRGFEKDLSDNHLRFRLRFRLKSSMKIGALTFKPFLAIEPFGDTKADEINRYRFMREWFSP